MELGGTTVNLTSANNNAKGAAVKSPSDPAMQGRAPNTGMAETEPKELPGLLRIERSGKPASTAGSQRSAFNESGILVTEPSLGTWSELQSLSEKSVFSSDASASSAAPGAGLGSTPHESLGQKGSSDKTLTGRESKTPGSTQKADTKAGLDGVATTAGRENDLNTRTGGKGKSQAVPSKVAPIHQDYVIEKAALAGRQLPGARGVA